MYWAFIGQFATYLRSSGFRFEKLFDGPRWGSVGLVHLLCMDTERALALGLEPLLTTSELADYLGLRVQAIYDMRCDGEAPNTSLCSR